MGRKLVVKGADFSAVKVKDWESVSVTDLTFPDQVVGRTGDLINVGDRYGCSQVAVPAGCTKVAVTSAYADRAPNQCSCFNSASPSAATFLGFSDDSAYEDAARGPQYLNVVQELPEGTTHVIFTTLATYEGQYGRTSLPMVVAFR